MRRLFVFIAVFILSQTAHGNTFSERAYFERAIKREPANLQAHLNYQRAVLKEGSRSELLKIYKSLLTEHPNSGLHLYLYARLLKDTDQAQSYLQRAVRADTTLFNARFDLAKSHYYAGHYDNAIGHYRAALRLKPKSALTRNMLGLAYYHRGHPRQAIAEYQRAVALQPNYVDAWVNLGLSNYYTDQFENAIHAYQQALKHAKTKDEPHLIHHGLGKTYRKLGRIADAQAAYQTALKHNPNYAEAHISLGNIFFSSGDYAQAITSYKRALNTEAETADLHLRIGLTHFNLKAYSSAIASLKTAQARDTTNVQIHFYLGQAYYLSDQPDQAETALQTYVDREKRSDQQARIAQAKQLIYEIKRDRIANVLR